MNFRVNDPPLLLGQLQYAWNNKKGDPNLAGQFKLGGWRHFGAFPDQRLASNGLSLAAPSSSGTPLLLAGDIGGWAVFEQQIYRVPNTDDRGIGIFGRIAGAPADRNLVDRMLTRASSSSVSATSGPTINSASPPVTLTSQGGPNSWITTIATS